MHPEYAAHGINIEQRGVDERQRLQCLINQAVARIQQQDPAQGHRQQRDEETHPHREFDEASAGNPDPDQKPGDQEADQRRDRRSQPEQQAVADSTAIDSTINEGLAPHIAVEGAGDDDQHRRGGDQRHQREHSNAETKLGTRQ